VGALAAGSVVLVSFPFSDLTRSKRRPALVLASVGREDFLLCLITEKVGRLKQASREQVTQAVVALITDG
jgi:hypothetical protein